MNKNVKNILLWIATAVVVIILIILIIKCSSKNEAERAVGLKQEIAAGKKVIIDDIQWRVSIYNASNGRCYKIHRRGNMSFVIPCE